MNRLSDRTTISEVDDPESYYSPNCRRSRFSGLFQVFWGFRNHENADKWMEWFVQGVWLVNRNKRPFCQLLIIPTISTKSSSESFASCG